MQEETPKLKPEMVDSHQSLDRGQKEQIELRDREEKWFLDSNKRQTQKLIKRPKGKKHFRDKYQSVSFGGY